MHLGQSPLSRLVASMLFGIGFIGLSGLANQARADVITYADVMANDVVFADLEESSTDTGPFYGTPSSMGNTLISPGTGFLSQSVNGSVELIDGRLQMTIVADPGFVIDFIDVDLFGSYFGFGPTAAAFAHASGTAVTGAGTFTNNSLFSSTGDSSGNWTTGFVISFPSASSVTFSLDHQLTSAAGIGAASFIDTSSIQVSVGLSATAIPEPSMGLALLVGCIGLVPAVRRRRLA